MPHSDDIDAASIASGFSDASTADAAGSVYDLHQHSPAALFMSPSASFGEHDMSGGYEPTMSPGAFQAAMAAGILAAQGPVATQNQHAAYASLATPQNSGTGPVALDVATQPAAQLARNPFEPQDESFTPSSVASNSAVSMPIAKPELSVGSNSAAEPHVSSGTPSSKPTAVAISHVSMTGESGSAVAVSPAGMSTNNAHGSVNNEVSRSTATNRAEANGLVTAMQRQVSRSVSLAADAVSPVAVPSGAPSMAHSEPGSTQMAEIAEVSEQAQSSEQGTELTSAAAAASDTPLSAGPPATAVDMPANLSSASIPVSTGKSLFSAVSKRPAEVWIMSCTSAQRSAPPQLVSVLRGPFQLCVIHLIPCTHCICTGASVDMWSAFELSNFCKAMHIATLFVC